jgi:hypothetical protein
VDNRQLTPRGAVLVGSACLVCGIFPILFGLGIVTPPPGADPPPPGWVGLAAGLMFVLAGLAVILDYGIGGGVGPDGDLKPGTPLSIRGANLLLGLGIVGLMTAVAGWVAFGPGPRTFSSTIALPFYGSHNRDAGEMTGRFVFGMGTVLLALMFVACGVSGVRRFIRAWRS